MEHRFWRNANQGTAHMVSEWCESDQPQYEFVIYTTCGLKYHTQVTGYTYDPEKLAYEQVSYPEKIKRCKRCTWPDGT